MMKKRITFLFIFLIGGLFFCAPTIIKKILEHKGVYCKTLSCDFFHKSLVLKDLSFKSFDAQTLYVIVHGFEHYNLKVDNISVRKKPIKARTLYIAVDGPHHYDLKIENLSLHEHIRIRSVQGPVDKKGDVYHLGPFIASDSRIFLAPVIPQTAIQGRYEGDTVSFAMKYLEGNINIKTGALSLRPVLR